MSSVSQTTLAMCLTAVGNISGLISSFSAAIWVYYALTFASLLIMRVTYRNEERPFKVLFVVPLLMVFVSLAVVIVPIKDQLWQSLSAFGGILLSVPVYFLFIYEGSQVTLFRGLNGECFSILKSHLFQKCNQFFCYKYVCM